MDGWVDGKRKRKISAVSQMSYWELFSATYTFIQLAGAFIQSDLQMHFSGMLSNHIRSAATVCGVCFHYKARCLLKPKNLKYQWCCKTICPWCNMKSHFPTPQHRRTTSAVFDRVEIDIRELGSASAQPVAQFFLSVYQSSGGLCSLRPPPPYRSCRFFREKKRWVSMKVNHMLTSVDWDSLKQQRS